jgi:hypothetical protein
MIGFRCDVCGRFIKISDIGKGATHELVTPDAEGTRETFETLCAKHAHKPGENHHEDPS